MGIYDFTVINNKQENISLKTYEGKWVLIVNTATQCGLTPQYEGLEDVYQTFKAHDFVILDFPCNQFMHQAPESDEEIDAFCTRRFRTTFPRFSKINVNGRYADPLYKYLKEVKPKDDFSEGLLSKLKRSSAISWNFAKFLITPTGEVLYRFAPTKKPEDIKPILADLILKK